MTGGNGAGKRDVLAGGKLSWLPLLPAHLVQGREMRSWLATEFGAAQNFTSNTESIRMEKNQLLLAPGRFSTWLLGMQPGLKLAFHSSGVGFTLRTFCVMFSEVSCTQQMLLIHTLPQLWFSHPRKRKEHSSSISEQGRTNTMNSCYGKKNP